MGRIRIRKTITLPNGVKMNINKGSVSYTVSDGKGNSVTINPKRETKTTNIKLGDGISYVDQQSTKKNKSTSTKNNEIVIENPKENKGGK